MIRIQAEDFDVGAELQRLTADRSDVGALCLFVGLVRDLPGDAGLDALVLEHYPKMTERELARIDDEAQRRWPLAATLVIHRYGRLRPGDRIVLVATLSAHRDAAFEACRFMTDWLKTKAPFWKREDAGVHRHWVAAADDDLARAAAWDSVKPGDGGRS